MPESLPRQENKLLDWSKNLAEKFLNSPSTFGLSESQCEFFAQLQQAFAESYQLAIDPSTRTVVVVADKNTNKQRMILEARKLLNIARATLGDDNGERARLGIGEKKLSRRRIPCPEFAPEVQLSANGPHSISIKLKDSQSSERTGLPVDVRGAAVFYHCGEQPPVRMSDWQLYGNQSRTRFTLAIGGVLPIGQMVWVTACWFNAKYERGPMSQPRSIRIIGGGELPSYIGKAA